LELPLFVLSILYILNSIRYSMHIFTISQCSLLVKCYYTVANMSNTDYFAITNNTPTNNVLH